MKIFISILIDIPNNNEKKKCKITVFLLRQLIKCLINAAC